MKLLIQINNTNDFNIRCDGFILGLKDYSNFTSLTFDVEEVINIQNKYSDKEIFLSINKNIFNDEINNLKEIFKKLKNVKILFYDLGIIEINKDFNLDLVWNQDHFVTNYEEINFYNNLGVKYAYISNEITYEEIKDIVKNSKSSLLVLLVCKPTIAVSKIDIDYGVIDTLYLDETEKIVDNIYEYLDSRNPDNLKNIENIVGNNTNFLYSPTIYKVVKR